MNRSSMLKIVMSCLLAVAMVYGQGCRKKTATVTGGGATAVPTVTTQPANQTSSVGSTATFSVVGAGGGLTYQWRRGGVNIAGATSATYTTPVLVIGDNGSTYDVILTNSLGTVTSSAATLTVNPAGFPSITTQPTNQSVVAPATATFTVVAGGTGPFTYQWYRGAGTGTPVGTNSANYTTGATSVAGDNGAQFHVTVTNGAGTVDSNLVTLTVTNPGAPTITTQPANVTVTQPATATFTVVAGGTGPFTYQWYRGAGTGTPVGTNSASYTTAATTVGADNGAQFHVVVTNAGGSIDSSLATLTVLAPPTGNPITGVPATVTLAGATGGTPVSSTFTVTNSYGVPVTLTLTDPAGWLTSSPSPVTIPGGGTQVITVTGDPVAAGGTQTATLTITNSPGGLTQTVSVTINVTAATGTAAIVPAAQDVMVGTLVTLNGSTSTGGTYLWTQISGPPVTLSSAITSTTTFTAPATVPARSLRFQLAASTGAGTPAIAIATVTVYEDISANKRIFLDPVGGNDANLASTGLCSKATPMKTLAAALLDATSTGSPRADIYMAAGTDVSGGAGTITLRNGVSVYGGFETTNWTRDINANVTILDGSAQVVAGANAVILANNGQAMSATDFIDGFTVIGGTGAFSMAISLGGGASPTIQNMTINGGTAVGTGTAEGNCECLRISPVFPEVANPIVRNCKFTLGANTSAFAPGDSIGILIMNNGQATIDGCSFGGGTPNGQVIGVHLITTVGTSTNISNCNFLGTGNAGTNYSAILNRRSGLTLSKSIIRGGTAATSSRGLYIDFRGTTISTLTTTVDRCELFGGAGTSDARGIFCRYEATNINAQAGQALTVTNSYINGGSSAAGNVAVEGTNNGSTGLTNPLRITLNNNTIDAGTAGTDCVGVYANGSVAPGVQISARNNILFTTRTGGAGTFMRLFAEETAASVNTPAVLQNNLFFIDTAYLGNPTYYFIRGTPNIDIGPAPAGTMTLATATEIDGLITATTKAGNINLTTAQTVANATVFFSTAPFNFHLKAGSPAIDAGITAGTPVTDFDGQTRPGGSFKDIGADEN